MLSKLLTKLVIKSLKSIKITGEDKTLIITVLIKNIGALPLKAAIGFDEQGSIKVNGRKLDIDQAIAFREGMVALKDSNADRIIEEQLKFLAIRQGVYEGMNAEMIMFSKAALWVIKERRDLIDSIVQT